MITPKLFLSSSFIDVAEYLEAFAGEKLVGRSITFIPTASFPEEYKGYVEDDRRALEKLGLIIEVLDISTASAQKIKEILAKNDFIYVSGGNTFYLLQELRNSGADKIIQQEVKKGKLYIGASAGSIITSKNILYSEKMDDKAMAPMLTDFDALNIVDFYPVPHHTNEPFKNAAEKILSEYSAKVNLIPISNTEVIQVKGNEIEIVGTK